MYAVFEESRNSKTSGAAVGETKLSATLPVFFIAWLVWKEEDF